MNIKKVIKDRGWTIDALAKEMKNKSGGKGISQPSMSQIVNGNPTLSKLQEIAGIIGVSLTELVADENDLPRAIVTCPYCGKSFPVRVEPEQEEKK